MSVSPPHSRVATTSPLYERVIVIPLFFKVSAIVLAVASALGDFLFASGDFCFYLKSRPIFMSPFKNCLFSISILIRLSVKFTS